MEIRMGQYHFQIDVKNRDQDRFEDEIYDDEDSLYLAQNEETELRTWRSERLRSDR